MAIPAKIWNEINIEWQEREYSAARLAVKALDGLPVDAVDRLFATSREDAGNVPMEDAPSVLERAFGAARKADPDGELLLALYLYGLCLQKWERTEDYTRIRKVVKALDGLAWPEGASADARAQLRSNIVGQARLMDEEMGVEEAMNCSCPVAMGDRARLIIEGLRALPEQELALDEGLAGLRDVVQSDATTNLRYFETIAEVADEVLGFVQLDAPGRADFDFGGVLKVVADAERDDNIKGDVYESELRAHRFSLEALRDHAEDPHLQIDAAELVYLYPFALEGIDAEETVTQALGDAVGKELTDTGLPPLSQQKLKLNDLWEPHGGEPPDDGKAHVRQPGYSGASIELPPIRVTTTADELLDFWAEVRLSRLGNHHVRVGSRLGSAERPASLHDINQALRRGSHGMGAETVTSEGLDETTVPRYAEVVIKTIASALGAKHVTNLSATFHVVLAARSISVQQPNGSTPLATRDELEQAVGASLLFHPVRHLTTSLEEWIRYPPPTVNNLLEGQGYAGDLVVRTDNTTVMYMPASPEWLVDEYEEMIEFVASIPPLLTLWEDRARDLTLWEDRARDLTRLVDEMLAEHEDETGRDDAKTRNQRMRKLDRLMRTLHKQEMGIRGLESDIRGRLAFLGSPALCRTSGQRQFLDELWKAAGLPALENELERHLTLLAEQQELIAALVSSIDERNRWDQQEHTKRLEQPVKIVLGLLGVASLAGLLEWMNSAFGLDGRVWAWSEVAILVAAGILVLRMYRGTLR